MSRYRWWRHRSRAPRATRAGPIPTFNIQDNLATFNNNAIRMFDGTGTGVTIANIDNEIAFDPPLSTDAINFTTNGQSMTEVIQGIQEQMLQLIGRVTTLETDDV